MASFQVSTMIHSPEQRATGCDLAALMGEEAWKLFKISFPLPGHLHRKILMLEPVSALIFCC